ncbi:hypothetical protein EDC02_7139 [Micromonospora sp. Llam0]|nr:hypothetical protein EDC02_7139 [Micromonospora sp. Llam0]
MADMYGDRREPAGPRTDDVAQPRRGRQPVTLPDWIRDPEPVRATWRQRATLAALRLPGGPRVRRAWWRWQQRQRLHRRFPILTALIAVPLAFVAIMALLSLVYWLWARMWVIP